MHLIITGSSGQIGTNLALSCIQRGHRVIGVDCRPNTWTDTIPCILADLRSPLPKAKVMPSDVEVARPDIVVHLAAHAKVHELVQSPHRALENIAITHNVLELCRTLRVPIVFASSREVYGDVDRVCASETDARFEKATSSYAASKIAAESMVHAYACSYGLRYLIFRLSNVYGRYDNDLQRMERVVPLFIRAIESGQHVTVFGSDKVVDFTYIDDCVDAIVQGIERFGTGQLENQTINIAFGKGHRLMELVDVIGRILGCSPLVTISDKRPGEVTHYVADIEKARTLLGFEPRVDLHEGIRRAVAWHFEWTRRARGCQGRELLGRAAKSADCEQISPIIP